jgi:hypothetical protein
MLLLTLKIFKQKAVHGFIPMDSQDASLMKIEDLVSMAESIPHSQILFLFYQRFWNKNTPYVRNYSSSAMELCLVKM